MAYGLAQNFKKCKSIDVEGCIVAHVDLWRNIPFVEFLKYNWNEVFVVSQVTELAGYTARVYNMFSVFDEVKRGIYKRTAVIQGSVNNSRSEDKAELHIDGPLEIKGN